MITQPPSWKQLLANPSIDAHIVQLYQDDEFFGDAISDFAAGGLVKGESIIIVATALHWDNVAGRLTSRGFDVSELRRRGQLSLLDADQTLPKFLMNNIPDARTFKALAHATIEKARAGGRFPRVRWWGEMVNVLYVNGNGVGSNRLEELFDEVAYEESIAIFCSFLMDKFDRSIYDGPLQNVCRTHATLIPSDDYDCLRDSIDQALAEVFKGEPSRLLNALVLSKGWSGPEMPAAQALLLALRETMPHVCDDVLSRARECEARTKAGDAREP